MAQVPCELEVNCPESGYILGTGGREILIMIYDLGGGEEEHLQHVGRRADMCCVSQLNRDGKKPKAPPV